MPRKYFPTAFKDEACKLVMEKGQEITPTARDLGIGEGTLRYWLVQRGWKGPPKEGLPNEVSDDPSFLKARIRELEQRLRKAEMEREILKKSDGLLCQPEPMRFAWIKQHVLEFDVACRCNILNVSRSGFYAWQKRPAGKKTLARRELLEKIREVHVQSRCTYGSPRVGAELSEQGVAVCVNTVAKYMSRAGICSKIKRRFRISTTDSNHGLAVAPNRLDRCFEASGPNRKWCCDITYVPTAEGFLYVAAVIDVFSRRIVGWAMDDHLRAELCTDALFMAIARCAPEKGLLHHSDRGVQYACHQYQQMLERHGIEASMSRRGDCYDNALMESFWGTLKTELTYHELYPTRDDARQSIFEYIEVFYNRQRRHSSIGYMSPEQFEASLN